MTRWTDEVDAEAGLTVRAMRYRLFVNETRTVLVRMWENGKVEVSTRGHHSHTWGPPVPATEEAVT